ncbi:hypothetical protein GCM10023089_18860 [Quisquiliibacterium transsilvanicum]
MASQYAKLTQSWSAERNSEWACRTYLATKMILNATVLLSSLEFARGSGMRAANPYFEYYAALSMLRGVVYLVPTEDWQDGELMTISHTKAANVAFDWMAKVSKDHAASLKRVTLQLRAQRELIAYRAPASGTRILGEGYDLVELLTLLAELAQLSSELLESSVTKNATPANFVVLDEHIHQIAATEIEGFSFADDEDYRRLGYVKRKMPRPFHLALFLHPGQSEDFMGAWDGDEDKEQPFRTGSPSNWQAIFEVP